MPRGAKQRAGGILPASKLSGQVSRRHARTYPPSDTHMQHTTHACTHSSIIMPLSAPAFTRLVPSRPSVRLVAALMQRAERASCGETSALLKSIFTAVWSGAAPTLGPIPKTGLPEVCGLLSTGRSDFWAEGSMSKKG